MNISLRARIFSLPPASRRRVLALGLLLVTLAVGSWSIMHSAQAYSDETDKITAAEASGKKPMDKALAPFAATTPLSSTSRAAADPSKPAAVSDANAAGQTLKAADRSIRSSTLFVDPNTAQLGRPAQIASQPIATWLGEWSDVQATANTKVSQAGAQSALAVLVAYNIPSRDCGSYSAGGANSSSGYRQWIDRLAAGIGQRQAIVILEPDALAGMDCLAPADQNQRVADISYAVSTLVAQTKSSVYIDAGNYSWQSASTMIERLKRANVAGAQGFSLNVSGFGWTANSVSYGTQIAKALGGKKFVVDTSRNGNGPAPGNAWCNPSGRALGERPTTSPGAASADAYLWIKIPGESDGTCNGGPSAGGWWNDYALELIRNAGL